MKKFIPYIAFACIAGLTATNGLPVTAGGCSNHQNKAAEIECAKEDKDCQTKKSEAFSLKNRITS